MVCLFDPCFAECVGAGILQQGIVSEPGGGGARRVQGGVATVFPSQQLLGSHDQVPAGRREVAWCGERLGAKQCTYIVYRRMGHVTPISVLCIAH